VLSACPFSICPVLVIPPAPRQHVYEGKSFAEHNAGSLKSTSKRFNHFNHSCHSPIETGAAATSNVMETTSWAIGNEE
jgi:hypothetical protein